MFSLAAIISQLLQRGSFRSSAIVRKDVSTNLHNSAQLIEMIKSLVPKMTHDLHKGNCGRIGVVGGCQEYTGAPYFAAISALKVGADLAHVFCAREAAPVIKSYSPELIVHPILDSSNVAEEMNKWLPKMHALVIGPGLGRDPQLLENVKAVIESARDLNIPMVIDADGVYYISQNPDVIKNYTNSVLTPNKVEFDGLFEAVTGNKPCADDEVDDTIHLSRALGNVTVVQKGFNDIISDGDEALVCCGRGSARRCGGQGDLLSGSMGTFLHWSLLAHNSSHENMYLSTFGPQICAAYAGCLLTRECNEAAFRQHGRSTTTSDMINNIHHVFSRMFEP